MGQTVRVVERPRGEFRQVEVSRPTLKTNEVLVMAGSLRRQRRSSKRQAETAS
jgi:hypothetical protein